MSASAPIARAAACRATPSSGSCHAEAHGTWIAERHANPLPANQAMRWALLKDLIDEYEQLCVEYVSDYYAERGEEWWPYK